MKPAPTYQPKTAQELVPPHVTLELESMQEFWMLGHIGISQLISLWRQTERQLHFLTNQGGKQLFCMAMVQLSEVTRAKVIPLQELADDLFAKFQTELPAFSSEHALVRQKLEYLRNSLREADRKPLLPQLRPDDWLDNGHKEQLVILRGKEILRRSIGLCFTNKDTGHTTLLFGPVSEIDAAVPQQGIAEGVFSAHPNSPCVMHEWEFQMLSNDRSLGRFWDKQNGTRLFA
ncbi:MAG: hypothetical protein U0517_04420 [Candidatus Andersenbacteria bacterium]